MYAEIVEKVSKNITGRLANKIGDRKTDNTEVLLEYVEKGGDGNYLEIGTLFGGTAIAVALLKKKLGQKGYVFCVDPLDGYYQKYAPRMDMIDTQSGAKVTPHTLFQNLRIFGVQDRVFVLADYSIKLHSFEDIKFAVTFIDGDHRDGVPTADWHIVKDVTTKYVVFDNAAETHPDVLNACHAASIDPTNWSCVHHQDITCVVKRL